jgi:hypothetical protein
LLLHLPVVVAAEVEYEWPAHACRSGRDVDVKTADGWSAPPPLGKPSDGLGYGIADPTGESGRPSDMTVKRTALAGRLGALAASILVLAAAVLFCRGPSSTEGAHVVSDPATRQGWQTIRYGDVRVDIPRGWRRSDMGGCEFRFEHWGPPGSPACGQRAGVAFYASATFDPARGPGVRRADGTDAASHLAWAGYVIAGHLAVYVSSDRRDVVQSILRSVRVT